MQSVSLNSAGLYAGRDLLAFRRWQPVLLITAAFMLLAALPTVVAMAIDGRTFNGVNVWIKPFKFQISVAIFLATLAWAWGYLDDTIRHRRSMRLGVWIAVGIFVSEVGYISLRAGLAQASHFNRTSALAEALYNLMGIGILTQVAFAAFIGVLVLRSSGGAISPVFRLSVGLGLIVGTVLGALTGAYMGSQGGHWVGGIENDGAGLPFLGWSTTGGDLRVAHFVGLHAMQGLPLVGWAAQSLSRAQVIIWTAAAVWIVLTGLLFAQALAGRPVLAM